MISKIIFALVLLGCLYLASLVYYRNPKGRDNKLFVFAFFWMIMWLIVNYIENEPIEAYYRELFLKLDFIIAPVFAYFWFLFCYNFLEVKSIPRFLNNSIIISAIAMIIAVLSGYVIHDVDTSGQMIKFQFGAVFPAYATLIIMYLMGGPTLLVRKYKRLKGKQRLQALYILTGFFISASIGVVINIFFQDVLPIEIFRVTTYSALILMFFTSKAITKHSLFDIRSLLQRGLIFSALFLIVILFYIFTLYVFSYLFQKNNSISSVFAAGVTTLIGVLGVPVLEKYFRKVTNTVFYKNKYDPSEAMINLSEILNKNIDIDKLAENALNTLDKYLQADNIILILNKAQRIFFKNSPFEISEIFKDNLRKMINKENKKIFHCEEFPDLIRAKKLNEENEKYVNSLEEIDEFAKKNKIELIVVLGVDESFGGVFLIGGKKSDDPFSAEDINLLLAFSNQAAVAFEKAQLYKQVKSYSLTLEESVNERTAEILALQEEQKQMMLEIAHGLQTPLTILKSEINLNSQECKNPETIIKLEKNIDRISKFIYDMLKLARLEASKDEYQKIRFDLSDHIRELSEDIEIICNENGIILEHNIEDGINILGNPKAITEAIQNLASNSLKYAGDRKDKKIKIKLRRSGSSAEIVIEDNGLGIKDCDKENIFKRFYRAQDADKETIGTGLGLAITKKLIEIHKGKISFESRVGAGTKFIIKLPMLF